VEYYAHDWRSKTSPTSKVMDLVKHLNGAGLEAQAAAIHKSLTTPVINSTYVNLTSTEKNLLQRRATKINYT
jgi:hypothetical protein